MRLRLEVADLGPDEARVVPFSAGRPPYMSLIVARTPEGLRAFWNVCQHLPVPLDSGTGFVGPGDLVCLTHGARYRPHDGYCVAGPCSGARLEAIELTAEAGAVFAEIPADRVR